MSAYRYPLIIKNILEYGVSHSPGKTIVYRDIIRYSYSRLYERIRRLANAIRDLGFGYGSKIGVIDYDTHRYLELYFAIPMMGMILHTINLRLPIEHILYTIRNAEDDVLIVRDEFIPLIEKICDKLSSVKVFIVGSDKYGISKTNIRPVYDYEDLINGSTSKYKFPDLDENTTATLFYTTGTTGLPKGVTFTHRQIVLHTLSTALAFTAFPSRCRLSSSDVLMGMVPYFHVHSWGFPYTATFLGMKQVLVGKYKPDIIFNLMEHEDVTFSHMVPTLLHMIIYHPKVDQFKNVLCGWKVNVGGSKLSRGLYMRARELGINLIQGYGLSETCPVITLTFFKDFMVNWSDDQQSEIILKSGFPIPLVKLRIIDDKGKDVKRDDNKIGKIVVRAPWCTEKYYKDPEKTRDLWINGWMHTEDMATIDSEGYITIRGRSKFMIKSGGEWISPLVLEEILSTHPAISEVAIISADHGQWGERPIAIIVLKPEYKGKVREEDLKVFMLNVVNEGKIAKWWIPDKFIFLNRLPKTSVGKIDRLKLMKNFRDVYKY